MKHYRNFMGQKSGYYLLDECRWTGQCTLQYQRRGKGITDKTVEVCQTDHIYDFTQDPYWQFEKWKQVKEQAETKRNCKHCAVQAWCSKCSGLQDDHVTEFCDFMQNHMEILDYIRIKNVILAMELDGVEELSFAHYNHALVLPEHVKGKKPLTHWVLLARSKEDYFAIRLQDRRKEKISQEQAFVLEAVLKGYHEKAVKELFHENCQEGNFERAWIQVRQIVTVKNRE